MRRWGVGALGENMAWHQIAIRVAIIAAIPLLWVIVASTPAGVAGAVAVSTTLARAASYALALFGIPVFLDSANIIAGGFHAVIVLECSALDIITLFAAAVLVYPASLASRLRGALLGALALAALNYIRVVTLLLIGMRYPRYVDFAHEIAWQAALIIAAIGIWLLWQRRIASPNAPPKSIAS